MNTLTSPYPPPTLVFDMLNICVSTSVYFLGKHKNFSFTVCDILGEQDVEKWKWREGIQRRNRFVSEGLVKIKQRQIRHQGVVAWVHEQRGCQVLSPRAAGILGHEVVWGKAA